MEPSPVFDPRSYWEERLSKNSGLQGVGYLGLGQAFNAWMYRHRRQVFKRTARRHRSAFGELSVLDIGSGTGEYLKYWRSLGVHRISGSDLTQTAVDRLGTAFPDVHFTRYDVSGPEPFGARYDAISCMDVLFHVVDGDRFEQAIRNLRGAIHPGGLLLLSDNFVHEAQPSLSHFAPRTLMDYEQALARNGFRILERRPMFHLMNYPADSNSKWLHRWWSMVMRICSKFPALGGALAMAIYPLEHLLVRVGREGPSTEIMVCEAVS